MPHASNGLESSTHARRRRVADANEQLRTDLREMREEMRGLATKQDLDDAKQEILEAVRCIKVSSSG